MLDEQGMIKFSAPLPGRGHGCAISPDRRTAVVFARRPGEFAAVIDLENGTSAHLIRAAKDRHFYGHGFFSPDGRHLYASENAYDVSAGRIGVYEAAAGYKRVGEFPSGGIGPHETLLLPDGETIVVANGGILTHPDYGRQKLNLAEMAPSLAYLDRRNGQILEQAALPAAQHQLSIRHLCLGTAGAVWFGCQYEGPAQDAVPLVGIHRRGEAPEMTEIPAAVTRDLKNYIGSIAINRSGTQIAVTSSRGGSVVLIDAQSHRVEDHFSFRSATGVAPAQDPSFAVTSGTGRHVNTSAGAPRQSEVRWDNHLARVEA